MLLAALYDQLPLFPHNWHLQPHTQRVIPQSSGEKIGSLRVSIPKHPNSEREDSCTVAINSLLLEGDMVSESLRTRRYTDSSRGYCTVYKRIGVVLTSPFLAPSWPACFHDLQYAYPSNSLSGGLIQALLRLASCSPVCVNITAPDGKAYLS